jgi:hypothetical protein
MNAAYVSSGSDILACEGCLTRLVSRCRPRKTATIGIRPVLLRAWNRQRFWDRCHDRSGAQGCNVRGQRENARTAYYDHGKREKHLLRKSHFTHPLFERPECAFSARRWCNHYPTTISGRLRQAPNMVSWRAEIIHHCAARSCQPAAVSGDPLAIALPYRSAPAQGSPTALCSKVALAARESKIWPVVQLFQIGQTIHCQLPGIVLTGRGQAFDISRNFPP